MTAPTEKVTEAVEQLEAEMHEPVSLSPPSRSVRVGRQALRTVLSELGRLRSVMLQLDDCAEDFAPGFVADGNIVGAVRVMGDVIRLHEARSLEARRVLDDCSTTTHRGIFAACPHPLCTENKELLAALTSISGTPNG